MKVTIKKLSVLKHPEKNVRIHSEQQIRELKRSLEKFGQTRALVIDENNIILIGNGYREKDKAERRGKPIDMMGYVIYREHTEIRSKIFLRARKAYSVAWYCMKNKMEIPLQTAYKCTSYYGWFKHTDSKYVKDKYNIDAVCAAAKRRISKHAKSEIYGTAARSALAACQ